MPDLQERCVHQVISSRGYFPKKSLLKGDCKDCSYDPINNKKCPCYKPVKYESEKLEKIIN